MKLVRKLLLLCLLFAPLTYAAAAEDEKPAQQATAEPQQEVVIEATRALLVKLAKEVQLSEARFYSRYNDFNTKREYTVHCYDEAHTGTRFKQKYCQPEYQNDLEAAQGGAFLALIASSNVTPVPAGLANQETTLRQTGVTGSMPATSDMALALKRPGFQKNMSDVVAKSPALQELLKEHADLWKRYEDTYFKVHGRPLLNAGPPLVAPAATDGASK